MDAFTMVVVACVAGEPTCYQARISELNYTTELACEAAVDDVVDKMTKELALDPSRKGKQVTFDVSCLDRRQLRVKLGVTQMDL